MAVTRANYYVKETGVIIIIIILIIIIIGLIIIIIIIIIIIVKGKGIPCHAMKAHEGCGCKGPHIHSHGTRKR